MRQEIENAIADVVRAAEFLKEPLSCDFIETASVWIAECFQSGGKILIAGNGGSLCDAMHFAEELTGVFRAQRKPLPAIVLSDPAHITCVANDLGFDEIFSRGIEAFGQTGDIVVILTTSGNSLNIVKAVEYARIKGLKTIAFLGKTGGRVRGQCDLEWVVPGFGYSDRIQEVHMAAIHILIEIVEKRLFPLPLTAQLATC
ncbi:MAG: SIS domain-containing protein [Rhabdochlamydiaceae bacterium]|jgi:D-sedoheptulose 7-phosphate isomerase